MLRSTEVKIGAKCSGAPLRLRLPWLLSSQPSSPSSRASCPAGRAHGGRGCLFPGSARPGFWRGADPEKLFGVVLSWAWVSLGGFSVGLGWPGSGLVWCWLRAGLGFRVGFGRLRVASGWFSRVGSGLESGSLGVAWSPIFQPRIERRSSFVTRGELP